MNETQIEGNSSHQSQLMQILQIHQFLSAKI